MGMEFSGFTPGAGSLESMGFPQYARYRDVHPRFELQRGSSASTRRFSLLWNNSEARTSTLRLHRVPRGFIVTAISVSEVRSFRYFSATLDMISAEYRLSILKSDPVKKLRCFDTFETRFEKNVQWAHEA